MTNKKNTYYKEMVFFPNGIWNHIVHYLIDFRKHHRLKFNPSLRQWPCRQRTTLTICTKFPAPLYWTSGYPYRDKIYVMYAQTHHQIKCSNYAHTWQPVRVTVLYTPTSTCPYSIREIRRWWDAREH